MQATVAYLVDHTKCEYVIQERDRRITLLDRPCDPHNVPYLHSTGPYYGDLDRVTIIRDKGRVGVFLGGKVVWMETVRTVRTSRGSQDGVELRNLKDKERKYRTAPGDK